MIAFVEGEVITTEPTRAIILSHGVGYELKISLQTYSSLVVGENSRLHTQLILRENDVQLYGFQSILEKQLFNSLISVSGIGGSTALVMLSKLPLQELSAAINSGNLAALKSIKGIGEKTAARIILELQGKLVLPANNPSTNARNAAPVSSARLDSINALVNLGFPRATMEKIVEQILTKNPQLPVDEIIKMALQNR